MELELKTKIEDSVAVVYLTGLGFVTLTDDRLETLFIHADRHDLSIRIFRPVGWDEYESASVDDKGEFNGQAYLLVKGLSRKDFESPNLLALHPQLSIHIDNGETASTIERWGGATDFSRSTEDNDYNDVGWILDIKSEGLLGSAASPRVNQNYPRSQMTIRNATVFSEKLVSELSKEADQVQLLDFVKIIDVQNVNNASKDDLNPEPFGKMTETIGAAIKGSSVQIKVDCGSESREFFFGKLNQPFVIEITNEGASPASDMGIYREFWNNAGPVKYDLVTEDELMEIEKTLANPIGVRKTCNLVTAKDITSISSFLISGKGEK